MAAIHSEPHPQSGMTVEIASGEYEGQVYRVEDWWDRVAGESWMFANGNPACLKYAMRSGLAHMPTDNEVVYGKIDGRGEIIHVSELP